MQTNNTEYIDRLKDWAEKVEDSYGMAILESLCKKLNRQGNYLRVRFMDETKTSQEFISWDRRKKPFFVSFTDVGYGERKGLYPIQAYMLAHNLKWHVAVTNLVKDFFGDDIGVYKKVEKHVPKVQEVKVEKYDHVPKEVVERSLAGGFENSFYTFFCELFGQEITDKVFNKYYVGAGAKDTTVFWTHDGKGFRSGKCLNYGTNGKRNKEKPPYHVTAKMKGNFSPALFGEHLIGADSVCLLVESEKTALLCTAAHLLGFFPLPFNDPVFLATGGTGIGSLQRYECLKDKPIFIIPDCDWAGRIAFGFFPKIRHSQKEYLQRVYEEHYRRDDSEGFYSCDDQFELHTDIARTMQKEYIDLGFEFGGLAPMLAEKFGSENVFFYDIAPERSDKFDIGDWVIDQQILNSISL